MHCRITASSRATRALHRQYITPHSNRSKNRRAISRPKAFQIPDGLQEILTTAAQPHPGITAGSLVTTAVFATGYQILSQGLTPAGIAHAWFLGATVFSAFGASGFLLVCLYFILGTLVTKVKLEQKQKEGIAEARSGRRGPGSVWGSGLAGMACSILALATGRYDVLGVGFVASFGSKLSDTVSSEIGKAYGRTTYLITSFQRVPRGTEGAVSLEGTVAGLLAAAVFSMIAVGVGQVDVPEAVVVAAACVVANTFESYLGATTQGKLEWLTNDAVNMIQICLASALAVAGKYFLL